VIAVNPFEEPPPYDLAELGVAVSARNPEQLAAALEHAQTAKFAQFYVSDPGLSVLKDGRTHERVMAAVLG
jgi:hypothetical protein